MDRTSFLTKTCIIALILIFSNGALYSSSKNSQALQDTLKSHAGRKQPVYYTKRLSTEKPVIDGRLDDECWKTGTWAGDFHEFIPEEGATPSWPTEFILLYDDKYVYGAIRAFDGEPDKIQRYSGLRDEFSGDMVGFNFDSYHDHKTGFEFNLSAWGQKMDLILTNPEKIDINWNAVWKGKTGLEDSAWVAEFEIPLSQLRFSREDEQVWGLHIWRWINRFQEESDWEYQTRTTAGVLYNYGELRGIKGLKKSQRLEIMPYASGGLKISEKLPDNPFRKSGQSWMGNAGLDAKIGISSNFTVDMTVNPDFGQVESDPSVMNLTAFETFYEEKRPFFLEGSTIFNYEFDNQSLFYSRRIGHSPSYAVPETGNNYVKSPEMTNILSAVKLSGTTSDELSVGVMQSVTANEFASVIDENGKRSHVKVEPLTNYTVARIQKGYNGATTTLGGIITSVNRKLDEAQLDFLTDNAFTGGLDFLHQWNDKEFFVEAKVLGSYLNGSSRSITRLQESSARYFQRPGIDYLSYDTSKTALSGYGAKLRIGKGAKGFWRYSSGITMLSPGLELNDIGYMQTADEINNENEIGYFVNKPVSVFRTYKVNLEQFNTWNFEGRFLGTGGHLSFYSELKNQWSVNLNAIYHSEAIDTKALRGGYDLLMPYNLYSFGSVSTDYSKTVSAGIEYSYEYGGNSSMSRYQLNPGITLRPLRNLKINISADYEKNLNELQYITTMGYQSANRYILGSIDQNTVGMTLRINLNVTPEFSVQYYGSPFISRGTYTGFKYVTDPEAESYNNRFSEYSWNEAADGSIRLDEDNDMVTDYSMSDPDFNFHQFRSNFVAKWEYRLGSFIYFVWSAERTGNNEKSSASFSESYKQLKDVFPNNVFLVKLNYWFSL